MAYDPEFAELNRQRIRDWLNDLLQVIPKALEMTDIAVKIDQLTDMLAAKVPIDLFDADSLEFVARRQRFFPSYADLWSRLQAWQRTRPKLLKALAPPDPEEEDIDPSLDVTAKALVLSWRKARANDFGHLRRHGDIEARMTVALGVLRRNEAAFAYVCRTDIEAERIALRRYWLSNASDRNREPTPEERVRANVSVGEALLAIAEQRAAHPTFPADARGAGRVVDAAAQAVVSTFEAEHGRKPGELSPDVLAAARKASGISMPVPAKAK